MIYPTECMLSKLYNLNCYNNCNERNRICFCRTEEEVDEFLNMMYRKQLRKKDIEKMEKIKIEKLAELF